IRNAQLDGEDAASIVKAMPESIPAGLRDSDRASARVLGKRTASTGVIACANHEAIAGSGCIRVVIEPSVKDEISTEAARRIINRRAKVETGVVRSPSGDVEIDIHLRSVAACWKDAAVSAPAGRRSGRLRM